MGVFYKLYTHQNIDKFELPKNIYLIILSVNHKKPVNKKTKIIYLNFKIE